HLRSGQNIETRTAVIRILQRARAEGNRIDYICICTLPRQLPENRIEDAMTEKRYQPQEDIVTLMTQFEQQVKDSPELPDAPTRLLRARLVFEEALEFV